MAATEDIENIVRCANAVFGALGRGHTEKTYQKALVVALKNAGYERVQSEQRIGFYYEGVEIGYGIIDLLVSTEYGPPIIVELKAVTDLAPQHVAQLRKYTQRREGTYEGLLINFRSVESTLVGPKPIPERVYSAVFAPHPRVEWVHLISCNKIS